MLNPFAFTYHPDYWYFLFGIALVPLLVWAWVYFDKRVKRNIKIPTLKNFTTESDLGMGRYLLYGFRFLAIIGLFIAFSRPRDEADKAYIQSSTEGIDIVIAFDISTSMLARDFEPDRLTAAKRVAIEFIRQRVNDRIGLVVYEGEAFTQCPLTNDHNVLIELFKEAEPGMVEGGTAIGMGLATAVNRLRESTAKSKVIILLSDGVNNRGNIDPITAADIAREYQIRVYSIGVGSMGSAPTPVQDIFGNMRFENRPVEIDEELLQTVSEKTGGKYFRAKDEESLQKIYAEINRLEKSKMNITSFQKDPPEKYRPFALLAIILLGVELILSHTLFKGIA